MGQDSYVGRKAAGRGATGLRKKAVRRTLRLRAGCMKPVRRYVEAVEVPDSLRPVPSPYLARGNPGFRSGTWGSSAQPLHRITQPKGACPSWADRSESKARSYAACPGSGTGPSRFLGTNSWKKPDNGTNYCRGAALLQWFWSITAPIGFSVVTTHRQEFTGVSLRALSSTRGQLSSIPQG